MHCRVAITSCLSMNARSNVTRICTHFLEAENGPGLPWPAYSDMSPIEHVWDALDRHVRQHVPVPAIEQEWDDIPQATIIAGSILCVALPDANGGLLLTGFMIPFFKGICDQQIGRAHV